MSRVSRHVTRDMAVLLRVTQSRNKTATIGQKISNLFLEDVLDHGKKMATVR